MYIEVLFANKKCLINLDKVTRISCGQEILNVWSGPDHKISLPISLYEEIKSKLIQLNIEVA